MKNEPQLPRLIALVLLAVIVLLLACTKTFAQQPPSTVFRTSLLDSLASNYSSSTKADLTYQGTAIGAVSVQHFEMSGSGRHEISAGRQFTFGLAYDTNLLDANAAGLLPDRLTALSVNLGFIRSLTPQWTVALFARPGFYGDLKQIDSRSLNAPVLVTASYTPRRELAWTFALSLNSFSDIPVLPVLGVRWQVAPKWNLELGFPHTGLTWQASEGLALRTDVVFQGGSYRVRPAAPAGPARDDTLLDYREIHAGAGFDCKLGQSTTLSFDAGLVINRRFDYYKLHYRLDGDSAGYLKLALSRQF